MSDGDPTGDPDRACATADTGHAAYLHAERMLDRYGVAYVCRHPEILLGIVPSVDSAYGAHAIGQGYRRNGRAMYFDTFARGRPHDAEDMLQRAIDAYRTLDEIFTPQSFARCEPQPPRGHAYGHIPTAAPGRPTQYGGWYC